MIYKIGDTVRVVDQQEAYDSYNRWLEVEDRRCYLGKYKEDILPHKGDTGIIVCAGNHLMSEDIILYGVLIGDHVFIIEEIGIELSDRPDINVYIYDDNSHFDEIIGILESKGGVNTDKRRAGKGKSLYFISPRSRKIIWVSDVDSAEGVMIGRTELKLNQKQE